MHLLNEAKLYSLTQNDFFTLMLNYFGVVYLSHPVPEMQLNDATK